MPAKFVLLTTFAIALTTGAAAADRALAEALSPREASRAPMHRVPAARAAMAPPAGEVPRVFGGQAAAPGAWPFQVALMFRDSLDEDPASHYFAQFCGGSLIAPDWVLTAAHCVDDYGRTLTAEELVVLSGANALTKGKRHDVAEVIAHPDYDPLRLDNDIALLRLALPAATDPVRLPDATPDAGAVTVTGWGMMEDGDFPETLMQVEVALQPAAACNEGIKEIYARDLSGMLMDAAPRMGFSDRAIAAAVAVVAEGFSDPLSDNMICAGVSEGMRDSCYGDSGGPLFAQDAGGAVQHGIVSWGEGPRDASAACGHANAFGVYTRVANYRRWIDGHLSGGPAMTR